MFPDIINIKLDEETKQEIRKSLQTNVKFLTMEQANRRIKKIENPKNRNDRRINICYNGDGIVKLIFKG